MLDLSRFQTDKLPDGTWGICDRHGGVVRLVDEAGEITVAGICQHCLEEMRDDSFFVCPKHGINPKAKGPAGGCPVVGCLGESIGPTEDEVEREALSIRRVWEGGAQVEQDGVDAPLPGPAPERAVQAGDGAGSLSGEVPRRDPGRDEPRREGWVDAFLEP